MIREVLVGVLKIFLLNNRDRFVYTLRIEYNLVFVTSVLEVLHSQGTSWKDGGLS